MGPDRNRRFAHLFVVENARKHGGLLQTDLFEVLGKSRRLTEIGNFTATGINHGQLEGVRQRGIESELAPCIRHRLNVLDTLQGVASFNDCHTDRSAHSHPAVRQGDRTGNRPNHREGIARIRHGSGKGIGGIRTSRKHRSGKSEGDTANFKRTHHRSSSLSVSGGKAVFSLLKGKNWMFISQTMDSPSSERTISTTSLRKRSILLMMRSKP